MFRRFPSTTSPFPTHFQSRYNEAPWFPAPKTPTPAGGISAPPGPPPTPGTIPPPIESRWTTLPVICWNAIQRVGLKTRKLGIVLWEHHEGVRSRQDVAESRIKDVHGPGSKGQRTAHPPKEPTTSGWKVFMNELQVRMCRIDALVPFPKNARTHWLTGRAQRTRRLVQGRRHQRSSCRPGTCRSIYPFPRRIRNGTVASITDDA